MKFKLPIRATIAFFLVGALSLSVITTAALKDYLKPSVQLSEKTLSKLSEIAEYIDSEYYYDVSEEKMTEAVAAGYVAGIGDKYSAYYPKEEAGKQADKLEGESYGIGIAALNIETGIYVWRVYEGSPAESAGLKSGDIISHVNGNAISDIGYTEAINMILGEIGKESELSLFRKKETFNVKVKCADCDIQSVFAYDSADKQYGRIEVLSFNKKTHLQFKAAVDYFSEQKVEGIVIDLRHNGGGVVNSAIEMLDYLLPEGKTVYARYNDGKVVAIGESDESFVDIPIVILVDSKTASASEIFASSMREHGSAVLIGETTYGKSVIQRSYDLKDGSRIRFTVGEYIPESGESYNEVGLKPDIEVEADYTDSEFYFLTEENDNILAAAYKYFAQLS